MDAFIDDAQRLIKSVFVQDRHTCLSYIMLMLFITLNHSFRDVLRHIARLNSRTSSFVMKSDISASSLCSYHEFILSVSKAINPNHLTRAF